MLNHAPRRHQGLRGDEFPAILQSGETVSPRGQGLLRRGGRGLGHRLYAYAHRQEVKAIDSLPDLTKPSKQGQRAKATGTDGEISPDCGAVTQ